MPLPETPVITVKLFNGNSTLMFLRLFSLAPLIIIFPLLYLDLPDLVISSFLFKYFEVKLFDFNISLIEPWATTKPPLDPASGPISII